ncbi:MAG: polysaccharide biosynthesis tyrosine autokinase, partial [Candidatus Aureabacteria bacterium]|nr:polysaccharide biosynthesis tyrosine autokinase [Candidatus Auribacterota bacterium]
FHRLFPPRTTDSDEVKHLKRLEAFKQNIKITHQRDTRLIQISYEHQNPKLAADMVNVITDKYIDYNLKRKINASNEALIWIKSEIEKIRSVLKDKENELQKFRDENNLVSAEEKRELLSQSIIDLNKKITEAEITYASYTKKYQIKHPKMQQLMELMTNLNNDFSAKRKEAIENEKKFIRYNELNQEINISRSLLEHIMHREKETLISSSTNSNNISVIDHASVPYKPVRPKRTINMILSLIIGLLGGIAWAYLLELVKKHVHSSDDFTAYHIPFLGYIPVIKKYLKTHIPVYQDSFMLFNHKGVITEIFNNLRTSVLLNSELDKKTFQEKQMSKGKSIVITSFLPGEGKTLISCNLAVVLAKYKYKVLLLEGDLRKPRIKKIFKIESKHGLVDHLSEKTPLDQVIHHSSLEFLDVIHAGSSTEKPSELLGSEDFKRLIEKLEQDYEIIIIDSPPAFSVTDPIILSAIVKKTVIVSKFNVTPKNLIPVLKGKIETTQSKIIGVIINQVRDLEAVSNYYTNYYYSS